ncbi:hypothetical protein [Rubritalea sp.]|uniref:hypothetical protein n=1 Tax=Rubritalea sp. TaxID=2109375 RepID=UPI003EF74DDB
MKDSFGNSFTKTLATIGVVVATAILFITTAIAGGKLGGFSAYLPLAILLSSSVSITAIWLFGRPRKSDSASLKKLKELENRVCELEARIHNAEIVDSFENRLAEKEVNHRFAKSSPSQQSQASPIQQ